MITSPKAGCKSTNWKCASRARCASKSSKSENVSLRQQLDRKFGMENIIGESPAMQEVFDIGAAGGADARRPFCCWAKAARARN